MEFRFGESICHLECQNCCFNEFGQLLWSPRGTLFYEVTDFSVLVCYRCKYTAKRPRLHASLTWPLPHAPYRLPCFSQPATTPPLGYDSHRLVHIHVAKLSSGHVVAPLPTSWIASYCTCQNEGIAVVPCRLRSLLLNAPFRGDKKTLSGRYSIKIRCMDWWYRRCSILTN